jgi:hypothetical protein
VAPKLGTGEGKQDPGAGGVGVPALAKTPSSGSSPAPVVFGWKFIPGQGAEHAGDKFDPVERIPVAWISPPLELSPNSTRWS